MRICRPIPKGVHPEDADSEIKKVFFNRQSSIVNSKLVVL
jgi:hypothetical protein